MPDATRSREIVLRFCCQGVAHSVLEWLKRGNVEQAPDFFLRRVFRLGWGNYGAAVRLLMSLSQFFWRVEVAEYVWGESGGLQLLFGDDLRRGWREQRVDFVASGAQSLLGGIGEFAAVDGTEGLQSSVGARHGHERLGRVSCARDQELQKRMRDERSVHRKDNVQISARGAEGGMNSGEGSAAGEDVFDDGGERRVLRAVSNDIDVGRQRTGDVEHAGQQGAPVEQDEGLVSAHAGTLASSEDEGGKVRAQIHGAIIQGL